MSDDTGVRQDYLEFVNESLRVWSPYHAQANTDMEVYLGNTYTPRERAELLKNGRNALELNKIRRSVNAIDGIQRDNQLSTVVAPVEDSDQKTADQLSEVEQYVYDKGNAHYYTSAAFKDMLKVGISLVGVTPNYMHDRVYGDLRFYNRPYNTFVLDPYFTRFDLSDCSGASMRDWVTPGLAKSLLPDIDPKEIDAIPVGQSDNSFGIIGNNIFKNIAFRKNLLSYDQYWRWKYDKVRVLVDRDTGETTKWPKGDEESEERLKFIIENMPSLELTRMSWQTVEYIIFLGGIKMYQGSDPLGLDRYPFVPIIGEFEPAHYDLGRRLSGLVRPARDAQIQFDKRHSKIQDIMDSVLNTGWAKTRDAVVDDEDLLQSGQGKVITLEDGKQFGIDLVQLTPPQVPQGMLQYQEILDKLIPELMGGNESLQGTDDKNGNTLISGRLAEIRASNGIRANRNLFDNFEYALKELGSIVLDGIQINYGPGKVQRIINEEPTEEFYNQSFGRYDAQIKQGVKSQSQRDAYYFELVALKRDGIVDIAEADIIEAMPMQDKSKLLENTQRRQEQAEEQQKIEFEDKRRHDRLIDSQTEGNIALGVERLGRAEADKGLAIERTSESQQNQAKAVLDLVKAAQELDAGTIAQAQALFDLRLGMQVEQETITKGRQQEVMAQAAQQSAALEPRPVDQGGVFGGS